MTNLSTLTSSYRIFKIGFRQILRDGMLLMLLPAPFLMGFVLKNIIPIIDSILVDKINFSISNWYRISDAMLISMAPILTAMIAAFVLLDERDEGTGAYYLITPSNGGAYLTARVFFPMLWAFFSSVLVMFFFALDVKDISIILCSSLIGTMQGGVFCMFLVSAAGNKVEGLALSKLTNILTMGFVVPWFISSPIKYVFGALPSFWIGELIKGTNVIFSTARLCLIGVATSVIWIIVFIRIFKKRIY